MSPTILNLTYNVDLRRKNRYIALSNLSIYYIWKNIKKSYKNSKTTISVPTWNKKFELPDGSQSILDIQDNFEFILKKHGEKQSILQQEYTLNKIENRILIRVKTGDYLELLTPERLKLLGSNKDNKR